VLCCTALVFADEVALSLLQNHATMHVDDGSRNNAMKDVKPVASSTVGGDFEEIPEDPALPPENLKSDDYVTITRATLKRLLDRKKPLRMKATSAADTIGVAAVSAAKESVEQRSLKCVGMHGQFALGLRNATICPNGYTQIRDKHTCRHATHGLKLGGKFVRAGSWKLKPAGCFQNFEGDVYLNHHTGQASHGDRPVCEAEAYAKRDVETEGLSCGFESDCPQTYTLNHVRQMAVTQFTNVAKTMSKIRSLHIKMNHMCTKPNNGVLQNGGWCYDREGATLMPAEPSRVDQDFLLPLFHGMPDPNFSSVRCIQSPISALAWGSLGTF
jgi:hypothetical protein